MPNRYEYALPVSVPAVTGTTLAGCDKTVERSPHRHFVGTAPLPGRFYQHHILDGYRLLLIERGEYRSLPFAGSSTHGRVPSYVLPHNGLVRGNL